MIIDFKYMQDKQKAFCKTLEYEKCIKYQEECFNVPMSLILDLHSDISSLYLSIKSKSNKTVVLNDLKLILKRIIDISIFLNVDLVVEVEEDDDETQTMEVDIILNTLFNNVSMLGYKKAIARNKLVNIILPLFAELVYSLGFTLEDLEGAYMTSKVEHMDELKKALGCLYEEFGYNDVTLALSQYVDALVVEEQKKVFEKWKSTKY